jgi:magnesium transporter
MAAGTTTMSDILTRSRVPVVGPIVGLIRRRLSRTLGATRRALHLGPRLKERRLGQKPGIELHDLEHLPTEPGPIRITCIDYSVEKVDVKAIDNLEDFIAHHRPEWARVRWINVDGLRDMKVIKAFAEKYDLHPLAVEDLLTPNQRPKLETYGDDVHQPRVFMILRMIQHVDGKLESEQIGIFLGRTTVLTFQEAPGDIWNSIRARLNIPGSRLRQNEASFLVYSLVDAIVDHCFPVLEHYGDALNNLEEEVLETPDRKVMSKIHRTKRELLMLRRAVWPLREVVNGMLRENHVCVSDATRTYMRDVYDHIIEIIDMVETYREVATSLTEAYMSSVGIRMNEVMKVLTVIGTIFIPLTFLAGVYGMNMPIPENHWSESYPVFWIVCVAISGGMLLWFHRKGWL